MIGIWTPIDWRHDDMRHAPCRTPCQGGRARRVFVCPRLGGGESDGDGFQYRTLSAGVLTVVAMEDFHLVAPML